MKDNFSAQSNLYVKFRPTYPAVLYDFIMSIVQTKEVAWDCGSGNGQVALELSKYFKTVYATDISGEQIKNAAKKDNVFYKIESAEKTSFPEKKFDLITVAQAIHWFNFQEFYKEVERTLKPEGILAVIGYGLIKADKKTDKVIRKFYKDIVGAYWDKERKYIDENYETIPFPFYEIKAPVLSNKFEWTFDQMTGYLQTWSAVQHFIKANNQNPVELIYEELKQCWTTDLKQVTFPILLRAGILK